MKTEYTTPAEGRDGSLQVTREATDPKFYGIRYAAGESRLLYHLKNKLNREGWKLIKKRMQKDGHMMGDEYQQYLRGYDPDGRLVGIYSGHYQIEGLEVPFNRGVCRLWVSDLSL